MTRTNLVRYHLSPEAQKELAELEARPAYAPSPTETVNGEGWKLEVDKTNQWVAILDDCDSVTLTAEKLVPLVLALLRLIFENKWYGDA
jgi:hypothetical protein